MNNLIEEFENETELPATWNTGDMSGYTKEFTEWLSEKVDNMNANINVNKNEISRIINIYKDKIKCIECLKK